MGWQLLPTQASSSANIWASSACSMCAKKKGETERDQLHDNAGVKVKDKNTGEYCGEGGENI